MVFEQIYNCCIEIAVFPFGVGDFFVVAEGGIVADFPHQFQKTLSGIRQGGEEYVGDDHGPGIDKGFSRESFFGFKLHEGVEGCAGGFFADTGPYAFAFQGYCHREGEDF